MHDEYGEFTRENAAEVFDEPDLPPMVGVPCGYCSLSPRFRWSPPLVFSLADVRRLLSLPGPPERIEIAGHRRDGRITAVRIVAGETVELDGEELRFRLDPRRLRSTRIHRVEIDGDRVLFHGRRLRPRSRSLSVGGRRNGPRRGVRGRHSRPLRARRRTRPHLLITN